MLYLQILMYFYLVTPQIFFHQANNLKKLGDVSILILKNYVYNPLFQCFPWSYCSLFSTQCLLYFLLQFFVFNSISYLINKLNRQNKRRVTCFNIDIKNIYYLSILHILFILNSLNTKNFNLQNSQKHYLNYIKTILRL